MGRSEKFGNLIKRLRLERNLSQQQLADQLVFSRGAVSMWESGKRLPDVSTLSRLADCLGVDSHILLDSMQEQDTSISIIVVEDVPTLLRGYVKMVQDQLPDAVIAGFDNGTEALEYACSNEVQIAFLDIELDDSMNGIELAKRLKELNSRINIVFLTSFGEYVQDAFDLYSSGYVRKPVTPEKIRRQIANLRFPVRGISL